MPQTVHQCGFTSGAGARRAAEIYARLQARWADDTGLAARLASLALQPRTAEADMAEMARRLAQLRC